MTVGVVKSSEIEDVEQLRARGEYSLSLSRTEILLAKHPEDGLRTRLLFNVLYCSTRLDRDDLTAAVSQELETLPEPEMSRIFVNLIRAMSAVELGRAREALFLIDANLETAFLERDDFRIPRYDHFALKGKALARLHQWQDALAWLTKALKLYPNEIGEQWRTTDILCDMVVTLMGLERFDEAYEAANQIRARENGDLNTVAIHYMAACRLSQRRFSEAAELYQLLESRLPCHLVDVAQAKHEMEICERALQKAAHGA